MSEHNFEKIWKSEEEYRIIMYSMVKDILANDQVIISLLCRIFASQTDQEAARVFAGAMAQYDENRKLIVSELMDKLKRENM